MTLIGTDERRKAEVGGLKSEVRPSILRPPTSDLRPLARSIRVISVLIFIGIGAGWPAVNLF